MPEISHLQYVRYKAMAEAQNERQKRLEPLYDRFSRRSYFVIEIHEVGTEFQIAEAKRKDNGEVFFAAFVNLKDIHAGASSFDQALLLCLSYKYTKSLTAALYAGLVLTVNEGGAPNGG